VPAPVRPASLSIAHLNAAVTKAVDAAVAQHKLKVISKVAIGPGIIMGPYLRQEGITLENAAAVAASVTEAANKALAGGATAELIGRAPLQPGFSCWDHVIICGYWPPEPWVVFEAGGASRE